MARHLRGVVAKILRAEEHLDVLDREIRTYLKICRNTTQLPTKINPDKNTIRLTMEPFPEPTVLLSMIIGDCVHNARCSLDHLWKRLGRSGNFPLRSDVKQWTGEREGLLTGLHPEACAIVDALQPCTRGKSDAHLHPLSILNKLATIDKHEAIHLVSTRSAGTRYSFREKGSKTEVAVFRPPIVFHDRTEFIITDVPPGLVKPGMNVNIKGTLFVAFKDAGPWGNKPVQQVLHACIDFLKHAVVGPLAPFTG